MSHTFTFESLVTRHHNALLLGMLENLGTCQVRFTNEDILEFKHILKINSTYK